MRIISVKQNNREEYSMWRERMMTTADPFVQFASKVGCGCESLRKEQTGKLSTAEVASFNRRRELPLQWVG
jgi:hypothetical protein